jgi:hypothetical protein
MPNYTYKVSPCWDEARSLTVWRSYNYPHPVRTLLALYRLAREYEGLTAMTETVARTSNGTLDALASWQTYLALASSIHQAMDLYGGYNQFGLMVGSAYADLIDALSEEAAVAPPNDDWNWAGRAAVSDSIQRRRTIRFLSVPFPFGSEMPWDSTGQEEIFVFAQRYADLAQASVTSNLTLAAVKAYTPDVPHALYHGAARRYFDFLVYGSPAQDTGTERGLAHYGAGLNSIVLLQAFLRFPNDTYALRVGYAASYASLYAVDPVLGSPSMGFHADPSKLAWDAYSCDWGQNTHGALGWGCYVVLDEETRSWEGYGCNVEAVPSSSGAYKLTPYDPARRRLFVAPLGILVELRTAAIAAALIDAATRNITLVIDHSKAASPGFGAVRIVLSIPTHPEWTTSARPRITNPPNAQRVRGAFEIPATTKTVTITWDPNDKKADVAEAM